MFPLLLLLLLVVVLLLQVVKVKGGLISSSRERRHTVEVSYSYYLVVVRFATVINLSTAASTSLQQ
jgi:hypothetical protein